MLGAQVNYIKKKEIEEMKNREKRREREKKKKHICPDFINKSIPLHLWSNRVEI